MSSSTSASLTVRQPVLRAGRANSLRWSSALRAAPIYLLWFSAAFDPVGMLFGVRYIALVSVVILLVLTHPLTRRMNVLGNPYTGMFVIFVVFIPVYGAFVALARGGLNTDFIDTSYIAAAAYFFCSLAYLSGDALQTAFKAQLLILRLLSATIVFCLLIPLLGLPLEWIYFFVEHGITYYGLREYGGVSFSYIYFIASPMLVFLLVRETWEIAVQPSLARLAALALPAVALFLTGTRANMVAAIGGIGFTLLWRRLGKASTLLLLASVPIVIAALRASELEFAQEMFSAGEESNAAKLDYLRLYADIFADPMTFLFGQGFNAHVWSSSLASMVADGASKTELTYIEIFRVFGALGGFTVIAALMYFGLSRRAQTSPFPWIAPASVLYLLVSALNPYLFSSNGMLLLGFSAAAMANNKRLRSTH